MLPTMAISYQEDSESSAPGGLRPPAAGVSLGGRTDVPVIGIHCLHRQPYLDRHRAAVLQYPPTLHLLDILSIVWKNRVFSMNFITPLIPLSR